MITQNGERKKRAEKIVKELEEKGWERVVVGATVLYQKPPPVVEKDDQKRKSK
jgi:hypothetical protein